jgi:propionate CoA-transferase
MTVKLANKIISADDAVAVIQDGDTVAIQGFVGIGVPDELILALERRFLTTGHPRNLTLVLAAAPGDGKTLGVNRLAHEGLFKRIIGSHYALIPRLAELAVQGKVEAYNFPLGVICHLLRDIAAHRPGCFSKVGLRTFVDPRLEGGKVNSITTEDLVELYEIKGEQWLFYKAFPINVTMIRGTTADAEGNITMEREALTLDTLPFAMAARNSRGLVVAQVERIAASDSLNPREVQVPGVLVDCVVQAEPANHRQTYGVSYNHAYSGRQRVPIDRVEPLEFDERKIIGRRCACELPLGGVINLGIGMPEAMAAVAAEERVLKLVTLTAEPGVIGGMPQGGLSFGAVLNPSAIVQQNQQFDFYDGGGLDMACLGMAQADASGNVNVSRFSGRLAGCGGFINISQNAEKVVFAGTFTTGGLEVAIDDGKLSIVREGSTRKFVKQVDQITYSGDYAVEVKQPALYVTERCVFRRTERGMELAEVAPGIDIERDILAHMDFAPIVRDPRPMDRKLFLPQQMNLEQSLIGLSLAERISYNEERNVLFWNLEGLRVRTLADVEQIRSHLEARCRAIGRKTAAIVNYDGFELDPAVADAYFTMLTYIQHQYYASVSRYSTSAFMRLKLLNALSERGLAPHIFESREKAQAMFEADRQSPPPAAQSNAGRLARSGKKAKAAGAAPRALSVEERERALSRLASGESVRSVALDYRVPLSAISQLKGNGAKPKQAAR